MAMGFQKSKWNAMFQSSRTPFRAKWCPKANHNFSHQKYTVCFSVKDAKLHKDQKLERSTSWKMSVSTDLILRVSFWFLLFLMLLMSSALPIDQSYHRCNFSDKSWAVRTVVERLMVELCPAKIHLLYRLYPQYLRLWLYLEMSF